MRRLLVLIISLAMLAGQSFGQGQNFGNYVASNAQTGTTYTVANTDFAKLVTFSNVGAIAVTLPQANTVGLNAGWYTYVENVGAGTVTITPTTSTIDGAATLVLTTNQGAMLVSNGTNYASLRGVGLSSVYASGGTTINVIPKSNGAGRMQDSSCMDDGSTVTCTDPITTTSLQNVVQTADTGYIQLPSMTGIQGTLTTGSYVANQVRIVPFVLPFRMTIRKIYVEITTLQAANFWSAGIYNATGTTLLVDSGPVTTAATGRISKTLGAAVTLEPGVYLFATTCTSVTPVFRATSLSVDANYPTQTIGTAANASSAGQLPSSTGAISAATASHAITTFTP